MNNQEILILTLIFVLIIIFLYKGLYESFESNQQVMLCKDYPLNSNCVCPAETPVQMVLGKFPMNYGEKSPYIYTCVPKSTPEPNINLWSNPPE